jgi:hypothetical protein
MKIPLLKLSILLVVVASMFSCKKVLDNLLTFTFKEQAKFSIPPTDVVGLLPAISTPEIVSSASKEFENNGSDISKVKTMRVSKMKLNITTPATQNFDFLNYIQIFISADGLSDQLIASKQDIPNGLGQELDLELTEANIADYIKKEKYSLKIITKTDETISKEVKITSDLTFLVTADPF